jgi:hypothetical protein
MNEKMIIILPELWEFIKTIHFKGLYESRQTLQFTLLCNVVKHKKNHGIQVAVPYWSLFSKKDYVDYILCDNPEYVFEERTQSFIFDNLAKAILGIEDMCYQLVKTFPEVDELNDNFIISRNSIKHFKNQNLNELNDVLDNIKI